MRAFVYDNAMTSPSTHRVDTIVAIATAQAPAGIGIVRLSGPLSKDIAQVLCDKNLSVRIARYAAFKDSKNAIIDDGIALWFAGPHSYTGEDVVELQAHGNAYVLHQLQQRCIELGARQARPGEFTERAFLNEKLDLAQAEAVADLISAGSEAAARAARRSLEGEFSRRVHTVEKALTDVRVYIEAALDFPEEEIDFLSAPELSKRMLHSRQLLQDLQRDAEQGKRLLDGLHVVIIGAPNAGKSSLLNCLAGDERAIVTNIAGTTRDVLRENISIDGLMLTLVDTAGLRESSDVVEQEGIRRARKELQQADLVIAVIDDQQADHAIMSLHQECKLAPKIIWCHNKTDLSQHALTTEQREDGMHVWCSAKHAQGIDTLRQSIRDAAGLTQHANDGAFSARARHLQALSRAMTHLQLAQQQLEHRQAELAAHELRDAHHALGEIVGHVDADALLGKIFASFCIGK
jgi:tRNA modification GTPase